MKDTRLHNFNPGPAVLPEEVLETVKENLLNYQHSGLGIMEISHRSDAFMEIIQAAEHDLRELLDISAEFSVIFTTGGASAQFSMVPMNILPKGQVANYILTGIWSEAALEEAKKFGQVHVAASTKNEDYRFIPTTIALSKNPAYLHFTSNNTVIGSQWTSEPQADGVPLVCDASSDLLHKKININKYGLIYAGAQKNLGPAGVTIVILRKNLLEKAPDNLPLIFDYRTYTNNQSLYNTPPTLPIYVVGLVLKWIKKLGGLEIIARQNREKAAYLYNAIDKTDFYEGLIDKSSRSLMNITFRLKNRGLEEAFVKQAEKAGFVGLKGHRRVGGIRASVYNALPVKSAQLLAEFMDDFCEKNR